MYALLLDMYLLAGRWNYVSKVRELMKEEKVAKLNDWSWTSIKGRVYSFRPDDRPHSQSTEMYELLEGLVEKAKSLGYIEETRIEIANQEDKEKADCSSVHHSEKLAIAFGLLNMPDDAPVRVVKSISMCRACHCLIKIFSELTQREIIVPDSTRLHKFQNGQCSCGDFSMLL